MRGDPRFERRWPFVRLAAAVCALLATASTASAIVSRGIQLDGDFADWQGVLGSRENAEADAPFGSGDLDAGSNPSFDLRRFAVTWDAQYLYFYVARSAGGIQPAVAVVYIDGDQSGSLSDDDWVLLVRFDEAVSWLSLQHYKAAFVNDPVTGDGFDEPGTVPWSTSPSLALAATNGRELEIRLDWAALTVAPNSPVLVHGSLADGAVITQPTGLGLDLAALIEDNAPRLATEHTLLTLTADGQVVGAGPGGYADLEHRVSVAGNIPQVVEVGAVVAGADRVELWSDPNGDGDPADGVRMATDVNGNGEYVDPGDSIVAAFEVTANGQPDSGGLVPLGGSFNFVIRVYVPAGITEGVLEVVALTFVPSRSAEVRTNHGRVRVGPVTLQPDYAVATTPESTVELIHRVCNHAAVADVIDVAVGTASDWPAVIAESGFPVASFSLESRGCTGFAIWVTVPPGTPLASLQAVAVVAVSRSNPLLSGAAADTIEVLEPVTLRSSEVGVTTPGSTIFYGHTLINAGAKPTSFAFSAVGLMSGLTVWSDPDGDGLPWDGTPILGMSNVAGLGGRRSFVLQVDIPFDAPLEGSDEAVVIAADASAAAQTGALTDTTVIRRVATYSQTPSAGAQVESFARCGFVYAAAGGLLTGDIYRLRWFDPLGGLVRQGAPTLASANGVIVDERQFLLTEPSGTWMLVLQHRVGAAWQDVVIGGTHEFEVVERLDGSGGVVSLFTPSRPALGLSGESLSFTAVLDNDSRLPFAGSAVEYLIYHDGDGDGQPGVGEWYIDLSGASSIFTGADVHSCRRTGLPAIDPGRNHLETSCAAVGPLEFAVSGTWKVRLIWRTGCGDPIAERSVAISVDCSAVADAVAGGDRFICRGAETQLGEPGTSGWTYRWSPSYALDDPFASDPWARPLTTVTYSVEVSDSGGCVSADAAVVIPLPPPIADAGPSAGVCAGDAIRIGTWATPGNEYRWSPATGLSNPLIATPFASPVTTTVYSLTVSSLAISCSASDFVQVSVYPLPVADATGRGDEGGRQIGPSTCDPVLAYDWQPPVDLSDSGACNPVATPSVDREYCLTVWNPVTGCEGLQSCVMVRAAQCAVTPKAVTFLRAARAGADVVLAWDVEASAVGGYRAYRHAAKSDLSRTTEPADRIATLADPAVTSARDAGVLGNAGVAFYRLVGLCEDGFSEGP